jgi:APA family basic amino acid/polyamine antiporter
MPEGRAAAPRDTLSLLDGLALVVGMVVGVGIFAAPSLVAQFAGNGPTYLLLWLLGGLLTLVGALCYAELANIISSRAPMGVRSRCCSPGRAAP